MLASASPRRAALLRSAGWDFVVRPAEVDETARPDETPRQTCERLARAKASACAADLKAGTVLAGDTVVVLNGELLGKPRDAEDARAMLTALSGRSHQVLSAVALLNVASNQLVSSVACAEVAFEELGPTRLAALLLDPDEWRDKAGAYAIQGHAAGVAYVVTGQLNTVIGLPLALVDELVQRLGAVCTGG